MRDQPFDSSALVGQLTSARTRYAEAIRNLNEADRYYARFTHEAADFRELVPDEEQRALIVRAAFQDCAYWDAETNAAECRLASLGRCALALRMDDESHKSRRG